MNHRAWAEINLTNFENNIKAIKNHTKTAYLCVIKANAYGHGDVEIARRAESVGVDYFGIATIDEAIKLRKNGIKTPILIFGYTDPEYVRELVEYDIFQTIYCEEYAKLLYETAKKYAVRPKYHLKLDTGMNRLGFDVKNPRLIIETIKNISQNLSLEGVFTHLAVADELSEDSENFTIRQINLFNNICSEIENLGINIKIKHYANSAQALMSRNIPLGDMVRVGVAQFGLSPFDVNLPDIPKLEPVMSLYARVAMVKEINIGDSVSYGRKFTAEKPLKLATITIGYADGYPRSLSNKAYMLINSKRAKIVGRVCMDQLMLDVSHIDDVKIGDKVTIIGKDGNEEITLTELAELADTIHYEIMCAISMRVERRYI